MSVVALSAVFSGCQGLTFYRQAIVGQYQILANQEPIRELINDDSTPTGLKQKFEFVLAVRKFAAKELRLPVDGSYLKYADLHRPFAVWNVYAAPALSIDPKTWWFPVVGSVSYRGYFSKPAAQSYAAKLAKKGLDVYVGGVSTYSTLGWFRDPLLNTFINESETDLAETIFHELAHQRLYVGGDTDFDEAFATAVAEEGIRRWLLASNRSEAYARYHAQAQDTERFVQLIKTTRNLLETLYCDSTLSDTAKLERKAAIIADLRKAHQRIKAEFKEQSAYDAWFAGTINNAKLNTVATYYEWVPAFRELLRRNDGNLEKFYHAAAGFGKLSKAKRMLEMEKLADAARRNEEAQKTGVASST